LGKGGRGICLGKGGFGGERGVTETDGLSIRLRKKEKKKGGALHNESFNHFRFFEGRKKKKRFGTKGGKKVEKCKGGGKVGDTKQGGGNTLHGNTLFRKRGRVNGLKNCKWVLKKKKQKHWFARENRENFGSKKLGGKGDLPVDTVGSSLFQEYTLRGGKCNVAGERNSWVSIKKDCEGHEKEKILQDR